MPSESLDELRRRVGQEAQAQQAAIDGVDEAAARLLGVNRTDLRCIELLTHGETTPGRLGPSLGLTTGSVTAMLDRLAKLGYLRREADPSDRRKVIVRITDAALRAASEIYGPIASEALDMVSRYRAEELAVIVDFLRRSRELRERHRERIASLRLSRP